MYFLGYNIDFIWCILIIYDFSVIDLTKCSSDKCYIFNCWGFGVHISLTEVLISEIREEWSIPAAMSSECVGGGEAAVMLNLCDGSDKRHRFTVRNRMSAFRPHYSRQPVQRSVQSDISTVGGESWQQNLPRDQQHKPAPPAAPPLW